MTLLNQAFKSDNLHRAWRWVQSNPEAAYKGYFRPLYANFRIAEDALLDGLRDRLVRGVYDPAHACKIYFPKRSGGLRPYSLLTVEDQVVYQALVNVVAERLTPRVRDRHLSEVFSHIYAGRSSVWFYRKWQNGYREMNRAAREAFASGHRYAASFDLTAFYDSVDHQVLRHFLADLGCDLDFNRLLVRCLAHWTATQRKTRIYHGHGIPQGPLSSGLLAEVVLHHFDAGRTARNGVRYLRYVDDIRLFAQSEGDLRRAVAELDYLSKDVGLFPQAAKTAVRKVSDIEEELKTVSKPEVTDLDLDADAVSQKALTARLTQLSPKFRVSDPTEFKFLLARALPRTRLTRRLLRVPDHQPYLYADVLRYLRRYDRLPAEVADWLIRQLKGNPIYAAVVAELLDTADGRLDLFGMKELDDYVATHWNPKKLRSADLLAALGRWGVRRDLFTPGQTEWAVRHLPEWWARSVMVAELRPQTLGARSLGPLLADKLADPVSDVAVAAAVHLATLGEPVMLPEGAHAAAGPVLEEFGLIPTGRGRVCGIARSFERLLGKKSPAMDWAAFFDTDYPLVERHAVFCYAYSAVDVTAWVNAMDVFNDWLVARLSTRDPLIGTCKLGGLGGFVRAPTSKFATRYPAVWRMANEFHTRRGESHLSHAWQKDGATYVKPTSHIPYRYLRAAKPLILQALTELAGRAASLCRAA